MNRGRFLEFLGHPFIISSIIWAVILILVPMDFSRYKVKQLSDEVGLHKLYFYYWDLDSDGSSEKVSIDLNDLERTKIIFYEGNRVMNQYDLKLQPLDYTDVFFSDYNNDGNYECYVFTANQDSLFLNIIDAVKLKKIFVADRFVEFRRKAPNSMNYPNIVLLGPIKRPGQTVSDILFYISTGYVTQPRNVYRYDIENDSLIKSPKSGATINDCILADINSDQIPEILLNTAATGNLNEEFPYSDNYSWLMVLDYNLDFLFHPVKLDAHPSRVQLIPIEFNNEIYILSLRDYFGSEDISSSLSIFSTKGKLEYIKPIFDFENTSARIYPNEENISKFFFVKNRSGEIVEMDSALRDLRKRTIPPIVSGDIITKIDADGDGKKEYIFKGEDGKSIVIVQEDFRNPVSWNLNKVVIENLQITQVLNKGFKPLIYLQFSDIGSYIRFEKNKLYNFKYFVYFGLFLIVLGIMSLIAKLQKYRLNIKLETEKKMAGLQMRAIRNQADPHFTLNVLNAIGSLYATENDRQKADYLFGKYARLIRQTVISSDQIIVSLEDELDFIKNYLDLEKFRKENSFSYEIRIAKGIDTGLKIPRMLIHTFVENAIKYGIRTRGEGGFIKIAVSSEGNNYQVVIEDNGTGIDKDSSPGSGSGTGKGMKILDELIELYRKLERKNIAYRLVNLSEETDSKTGLRVIITIPFRKSSSGN